MKQKTFIRKDGTNVTITELNYKNACRSLKVSYSILERVLDLRPNKELSDSDVGFYDIETKDNKFHVGMVNDELFTDPTKMVEKLSTFKIVAGFNNYRFDNEFLAKASPHHFTKKFQNNFSIYQLDGAINLDLLPIFKLWKPRSHRHTLRNLAKTLGTPQQFGQDQLMKKCAEDIKILKKFYPFAKKLLNTVETVFFVDPETTCLQYYTSFSKMRRWFLQSFALQLGIFPDLMKIDNDRKLVFYRMNKPGYYENIKVFDVTSAYPSTAILIKSQIWANHDFALYETKMTKLRRENPDIGNFLKWCANSTIGDMNYTEGYLFDKNVIADIWGTFEGVMKNWVKLIGPENVFYSYTDCVYTCCDDVPVPPNYKISLKAHFEWVVIYNQIRILGLTKQGKFHRVHFDRKMNLKLYDYLDEIINKALSTNYLKVIDDPHSLEIDLSKFPADAFEIVVWKKDNVCKNVEYLMLWDDFKFGLNTVYLGKGQSITNDKNKINYKRYNKYVRMYLNLYKFPPRVTRK